AAVIAEAVVEEAPVVAEPVVDVSATEEVAAEVADESAERAIEEPVVESAEAAAVVSAEEPVAIAAEPVTVGDEPAIEVEESVAVADEIVAEPVAEAPTMEEGAAEAAEVAERAIEEPVVEAAEAAVAVTEELVSESAVVAAEPAMAAVDEPVVALEEPTAEAVVEESTVEGVVAEPTIEIEEPAAEAAEESVAVADVIVAVSAEPAVDVPAMAEPSAEVAEVIAETADVEIAERAIEEPVADTADPVVEPVAEEAIAEIVGSAVEEPASEAPVVDAGETVVDTAAEEPTEAIAEPVVDEPAAVAEEVTAVEMPVADEEVAEEPVEVGSPIDEYEDLATSATEARDGAVSANSGLSDGGEDFVLVSAGDATGSPAPESQDAPSGTEVVEDAQPEPVSAGDNDSSFMAARSLSVPPKLTSDDAQEAADSVVDEEPLASADLIEDTGVVAEPAAEELSVAEPVGEESSLAEAEVPAAVADVSQPPVEPIAAADEPEASAAPSDTGSMVIKDRETTTAPPAAASTIGDLLNIDTIRSFDGVDSVLYPSEAQAGGEASPLPEANVTTPSYVMHYPESLFGDTNSITPGLITMDDLHTAQKASAVVGVSAINATSVGRKSRDSGHHHHHLLGESEASVSQRMKRFIAGKRSDGHGRTSTDAEPVSPVKGNVAGLFSQYRSSRSSMETKRASATTSALESVAASEMDLTEATRGTRSATVHGGSFEDELAKHGHTIPGSFPAENVAGPGSDGEGVNLAEAEHGDGNTSENEGGKDRHRRHTILGVFKRIFR
ncbi:hypothetical protein IWW57_004545, partial [Coemansia sp. S610]